MATLQLDGWEELAKQLDRVDDRLTKRAKLEAVKAAGEVVAARAKQLCPIGDAKEGRRRLRLRKKPLKLTIAVEVRDYDQRALAVVGPEYPAGAHAHLVEYGHDIVIGGAAMPKQRPGWTPELIWDPKHKTWKFKHGAPRRPKAGTVPTGTRRGRTTPRPFMRPAFDETKDQQQAAMQAVVTRTLRELGG
jgi:HK97 gp10 family phage protein